MDAEIKKQLHKAIEEIGDEIFLQLLYEIISSKSRTEKVELTPDQLQILESRSAKHHRGESQSFTWEEVKERIKK